MSPVDVAKIAFEMHEKKYLSRQELVHVLRDCVNITALENGYANEHGLPFPTQRRRQRRRKSRRAP